MSTTYTAVILNILSFILPKIGIEVGSEAVTTTVQTIVTIATGIWILVERYKKGGITIFGTRK